MDELAGLQCKIAEQSRQLGELRVEVEQLTAALAEIVEHTPSHTFDGYPHKVGTIARTALKNKEKRWRASYPKA